MFVLVMMRQHSGFVGIARISESHFEPWEFCGKFKVQGEQRAIRNIEETLVLIQKNHFHP